MNRRTCLADRRGKVFEPVVLADLGPPREAKPEAQAEAKAKKSK